MTNETFTLFVTNAPTGTTAGASDKVPLIQGGVTKQVAPSVIAQAAAPNVVAYGAAYGGGASTAAVAAALSDNPNGTIFFPKGTYVSTTAVQAQLGAKLFGYGQLQTADGNKRGKFYSEVNTRPDTTNYYYGSYFTGLNGDWSQQNFAIEHIVNASSLHNVYSNAHSSPFYLQMTNFDGNNSPAGIDLAAGTFILVGSGTAVGALATITATGTWTGNGSVVSGYNTNTFSGGTEVYTVPSGSVGGRQSQQVIQVTGASPGAYNGCFRANITATNTLQYTMNSAPGTSLSTTGNANIVSATASGGVVTMIVTGLYLGAVDIEYPTLNVIITGCTPSGFNYTGVAYITQQNSTAPYQATIQYTSSGAGNSTYSGGGALATTAYFSSRRTFINGMELVYTLFNGGDAACISFSGLMASSAAYGGLDIVSGPSLKAIGGGINNIAFGTSSSFYEVDLADGGFASSIYAADMFLGRTPPKGYLSAANIFGTITAGTASGTSCSITTTGYYWGLVGTVVASTVISGCTPSNYNGTYTVTVAAQTQVPPYTATLTYTSGVAPGGVMTSFGFAIINGSTRATYQTSGGHAYFPGTAINVTVSGAVPANYNGSLSSIITDAVGWYATTNGTPQTALINGGVSASCTVTGGSTTNSVATITSGTVSGVALSSTLGSYYPGGSSSAFTPVVSTLSISTTGVYWGGVGAVLYQVIISGLTPTYYNGTFFNAKVIAQNATSPYAATLQVTTTTYATVSAAISGPTTAGSVVAGSTVQIQTTGVYWGAVSSSVPSLTVAGCTPSAYNGTYTTGVTVIAQSATAPYAATLQYTAGSAPGGAITVQGTATPVCSMQGYLNTITVTGNILGGVGQVLTAPTISGVTPSNYNGAYQCTIMSQSTTGPSYTATLLYANNSNGGTVTNTSGTITFPPAQYTSVPNYSGTNGYPNYGNDKGPSFVGNYCSTSIGGLGEIDIWTFYTGNILQCINTVNSVSSTNSPIVLGQGQGIFFAGTNSFGTYPTHDTMSPGSIYMYAGGYGGLGTTSGGGVPATFEIVNNVGEIELRAPSFGAYGNVRVWATNFGVTATTSAFTGLVYGSQNAIFLQSVQGSYWYGTNTTGAQFTFPSALTGAVAGAATATMTNFPALTNANPQQFMVVNVGAHQYVCPLWQIN